MTHNGETPAELSAIIEKQIGELPPLPALLSQILDLTSREDARSADVERLIGTDQALTSKVLRVANSAYYGLERQVETVGQAAVILGLRQIRNLSLSIAALGLLSAKDESQRKMIADFWQYSLASAIAAQLLGKRRDFNVENSESLYVAGLLHDVGRLFLAVHLPGPFRRVTELVRHEGMRLCVAESAVLGTDHTRVGAELARRWRFPEFLEEIALRHEGPFEEGESACVKAVHLAAAVASSVSKGEMSADSADPSVMAWALLDDEEWNRIRDEVETRLEAFRTDVLAEAA